MAGVNVGEIVNKALLRYDGHTSLISLSTATDPHCNWGSKEGTNNGISEECELILLLNLALILPSPSLRASHVLSESVCDPGVAEELLG